MGIINLCPLSSVPNSTNSEYCELRIYVVSGQETTKSLVRPILFKQHIGGISSVRVMDLEYDK